jgi:subtilisin family serine protease
MKTVHNALALTIGVASLSLLAGCAGGGGGNPSVPSSTVSPDLGSQTRTIDPYPNYVAGPDAIPNSYIVMLKDGAIGGGAAARTAARTTTTAAVIANPVQVAADDLVATYGGTVNDPLEAINQFTATMTVAQAKDMSNDLQVDLVIANCPMYLDGQRILSNNILTYSTGLDLVDQQNLTNNGIFNFIQTGAGVHVYVMDSGIKVNHPEFQGRNIDGMNFRNDRGSTDITDDLGHGTAVASIIGGPNVGVAPGVILHALRIFDGNGGSDQRTVCNAINWLMKNKPSNVPIVLNCSFGTTSQRKNNWPYPSTTNGVDSAIRKLTTNGVTVVASAGNGNNNNGVPMNANKNSPGGTVGELIVVSAAEKSGYKSSYANYGSVVDIFACPQTQVANAYPNVNGNYRNFSGTSATAPLVAGTAALLLQTWPTATNAQVEGWLKSNATGSSTPSILNGPSLNGSPNLMLYKAGL